MRTESPPAVEGQRSVPGRSPTSGLRSVPAPGVLLAHFLTIAGALAFWAWEDRKLWFFGDDWDFLFQRAVLTAPGSPQGIWYPHNEHWSTLPLLLWRGLYAVFHLQSYWPYLVPLFVVAGGVMHLTWRLCLRCGVSPWVAAAAVALLGFLGAGAEDLGWAFQVGFVASVFFGLLGWDLIDAHSRLNGSAPPSVAGDAAASLALLAAMMCSTIGDAMVVGAALVLFARRPPRRALAVLALPVVAWAAWFALIGHKGLVAPSDSMSLATFTSLPGYVWSGFSSSLGRTFNIPGAGGVLFVGLGAWAIWNLRRLWLYAPSLLALPLAVAAFFALAASGRDALGSYIPGRYVYVCMALLLPLVAAVLTSLGGWKPARVLAVCLLLATLLGNVGQARSWMASRDRLVASLKEQTLAVAKLVGAGARDVSGPLAQPVQYEPNLDIVDLARAQRAHLFPAADLSAEDLVNARAALATALGPAPLARGRFVVVGTVYGRRSVPPAGCQVFTPTLSGQAMQVHLDIAGTATSASAKVEAPPATGGTEYLGAVLSPPHSPASSVVTELAVPPGGTGYLSYNDPGTELVLFWSEGTPLTLCGTVPAP